MEIRVGTSGYSYKEWKGRFYPEDLPASQMLRFYSGQFSTVEINNTFYRMPERKMLEHWATQVPESFRFVLKAPQRITHRKRLAEVDDDIDYFFTTAQILGERLGPILFQLPPYFRKDLNRLRGFLALLPEERPAAFEFRHESWFDDEVMQALRSRGVALCIAETDETSSLEMVATARYGYLRLRKTDYSQAELNSWAERIRAQSWDPVYVFFKHEDEAKGPQFAAAFRQIANAA